MDEYATQTPQNVNKWRNNDILIVTVEIHRDFSLSAPPGFAPRSGGDYFAEWFVVTSDTRGTMILGLDPIYIIILVMLGVIGVIGFMANMMRRMLIELRGITNENRKLRKFVQSVHRDNILLDRSIRATRDIKPDDSERVTSGSLDYVRDSRTDITAKLPRVSFDMAATAPMPRR